MNGQQLTYKRGVDKIRAKVIRLTMLAPRATRGKNE